MPLTCRINQKDHELIFCLTAIYDSIYSRCAGYAVVFSTRCRVNNPADE